MRLNTIITALAVAFALAGLFFWTASLAALLTMAGHASQDSLHWMLLVACYVVLTQARTPDLNWSLPDCRQVRNPIR